MCLFEFYFADIALSLVCIPLNAAWVLGFAYLIWGLKRLPVLNQQFAPAPERWPLLSVIIPACNEAANLESAVSTLTRQDYPHLEIILVDDRSTDSTGEVIDRLAPGDSRIRAVHVRTLPEGWLGKVHALQRGVEIARGEWLLFTDADIHFSEGTLRQAIAVAVQQGIDHLTLIPRTIQNGFWLDVAVRAFGVLFFLTTRAASVNQPGSKAFVGIGAFNLVKAQVFRRTAGFEWLRLETGDDVGLGMMIKRAGGASRLAVAYDNLSVRWYESVPAMFKGLEKNLFGPVSRYGWWSMLLQVALIWALVAAPVVALTFGAILESPPLWIAGAAAVAMHLVFALICFNESPAEILSLLLLPAGMLLIGLMMLRAGFQCVRNNGIDWRGTHYPLEQLRAGQRIRFLQLPFAK
ncbi:MAG TPA: glycosyltransferase family 2 protein [Candidatus Binatia bacterium]|jgi:glycosyltransferase involved in cell wall biosynthesis